MVSNGFRHIAFFAALAVPFAVGATTAGAGGGKDYYSDVKIFDKPHDGYSGRVGAYMCDYQRKPNLVCKSDKYGNEKCVRKGWQLRQHCY